MEKERKDGSDLFWFLKERKKNVFMFPDIEKQIYT